VYLQQTAYDNSIYSNTISTSNASSFGIYLNIIAYNNTFYDNNITTKNSSGSYGIYLLNNVNNNTFYRNTITSLAIGILINGSGQSTGKSTRFNTFTNDTIVPCTTGCASNYQDIVLTSNVTDITFLNVSFNKSRVAFVPRDLTTPNEINNLTVKWFLTVNVTDVNNNPLEAATVQVNDTFDTTIFTGDTNSDGFIYNIEVTEYEQNGTVDFNAVEDTHHIRNCRRWLLCCCK